MNSPLVSIIIPVYNAGESISKSLNSILNQTYAHIEVVIINDCSTDNTLEVIERFRGFFTQKNNRFVLLDHSKNKGVAAARNTGISNATGDYIYYVDADDFITNDCIEELVYVSNNGIIDIIGCNWFLKLNNNSREMKQPKVSNGIQAIEYMAKGRMKWNLWLFMVKRSLYIENNIRFIDGLNMGEDMMVMFKLFSFANSVQFVNKPIYYYDKSSNQNSLTNSYTIKHKEEVSSNLEELNSFFVKTNRGIIKDWESWYNFLKLNIKLPLLISSNSNDHKEWFNLFKESNCFILQNDLISKKIKILQYMASKKQFWFVRFYYFLISKVIYNLLYR